MILQTDKDFEKFFIKLAIELDLKNFSSLKKIISEEAIRNKEEQLLIKLALWEKKLELDRKKLQEVFIR